MRKIFALALIVLASGCIDTPISETVTVTDVADGDTMDIRYINGSTETVRLIGVDTPETYGEVSPEEYEGIPDTEESRNCLKNWAQNASNYAEHLDGRNVTLRQDKIQDLRGDYGRLLAYLHVNRSEDSFNYKLVENGYARVYESRFAEKERFLEAEEQARNNSIGVWSCS